MELTIGMSDQDAWRTFKIGLAAAGEDQAQRFADLAKRSDNKVIKSRAVGLEVTKIIYADEETRQFYNDQVHDQRVLGKICAREWKCPAVPDYDLTEEEKASAPLKPEEFEFWVEEDVLEVCFVGLKMEATFRDLNCGVQYFDQVIAVYCSFYTFLANEWMIGWKNPELLADGRQEMDAEADEGDDGLD